MPNSKLIILAATLAALLIFPQICRAAAQQIPVDSNASRPSKPMRIELPKDLDATPPPRPQKTNKDAPPSGDPKPAKSNGKTLDPNDVDYSTLAMLRAAFDKAVASKFYYEHFASFDAFPQIPGDDTVSTVFIPHNHPTHKIKYFTFFIPDSPAHGRVYGYIAIDARTNLAYGHFDGDGDGVFEQHTTQPTIQFEKYTRSKEKK